MRLAVAVLELALLGRHENFLEVDAVTLGKRRLPLGECFQRPRLFVRGGLGLCDLVVKNRLGGGQRLPKVINLDRLLLARHQRIRLRRRWYLQRGPRRRRWRQLRGRPRQGLLREVVGRAADDGADGEVYNRLRIDGLRGPQALLLDLQALQVPRRQSSARRRRRPGGLLSGRRERPQRVLGPVGRAVEFEAGQEALRLARLVRALQLGVGEVEGRRPQGSLGARRGGGRRTRELRGEVLVVVALLSGDWLLFVGLLSLQHVVLVLLVLDGLLLLLLSLHHDLVLLVRVHDDLRRLPADVGTLGVACCLKCHTVGLAQHADNQRLQGCLRR
mmetsp:Transcript_147322/g.473336  ORF Transcript_147322/g.473336 Transcript_147322/m.473336 type:complete len:331 (-) Transcript_147322:1591-2583(-)